MKNEVLFDLSYGLYIIGSRDEKRETGCVVNSIIQVSAEPKSFAVSVNRNNYTNQCIKNLKALSVAILSEKTDPSLIGTFGFQSSKDVYKYEGIDFITVGDQKLPVVTNQMCGYFFGEVKGMVESHSHTVFIADIVDGDKLNKLPPMTYAYYHKVVKGKTPKNAATYVQEESKPSGAVNKYVCSVCGYEMEMTEEEFGALPEDWKCPICSVPKTKFNKI